MTITISLNDLSTDEGTQSRCEVNEETVLSYAQDLEDGATFPPVTVFQDGETYYLADGFHRVAAYREVKREEIEADIREGGRREAILFSVGANAAHGLRRTNADKRRAVEILLKDEEWSKWSDREIAKKCWVAPNTVGNGRRNLSAQNAQIDPGSTTRTATRNGTTFQQKVRNSSSKSLAPRKPSPPVSGDAPRKGDGPEYFAYYAKGWLEKIDLDEPEGMKAVIYVRDWLNRQLEA